MRFRGVGADLSLDSGPGYDSFLLRQRAPPGLEESIRKGLVTPHAGSRVLSPHGLLDTFSRDPLPPGEAPLNFSGSLS